MIEVDDVPIGAAGRVYAEGWQSWSPTTWYLPGERSHRPHEAWQHLMRFRPGTAVAPDGVQAEGLLVVDPGDGTPVRTYGTADASSTVPTLIAEWREGRVVVSTDGDVDVWTDAHTGDAALAAYGDRLGQAMGARVATPQPRVWCSWYEYFEEVTDDDVLENLRAIDEHGLDVDVVQIDDGWSLGTGAWTVTNPRFGSFPDAVAAIRDRGRRAGAWLAPFTVGARSEVAMRHPEWLTGPAGRNWGDDLMGLDLTAAGVRDHLREVFTRLRDLGVDYLKLDFLYAGAVPGAREDGDATPVAAYRAGLALVRDVMGDGATILGCGAPILPAVGLVDAMRVSPDTFHQGGDDGSQGLRGRMSLEARAWQDARLFRTDPDCLIARPEFTLREEWADVVLAAPGVRGFSDRIVDLDDRGLQLIRELLA